MQHPAVEGEAGLGLLLAIVAADDVHIMPHSRHGHGGARCGARWQVCSRLVRDSGDVTNREIIAQTLQWAVMQAAIKLKTHKHGSAQSWKRHRCFELRHMLT